MKTVAEYKRLDELCHLNMGQSPDSNSYNDNGEGLPFYQGNADFGVIHPKVRVWCNAPTKIVDEGSLLISVRAPIGALNIANERCCIGRGLAGISSKDGVNQKYIYYCLKGKNRELNAKGTGSTFKAIAKNALGEVLVKVVSEEEQEKIVFSLDKITTIIESRKQQLQELDNLVKARFVEMFGSLEENPQKYEVCEFADVVEYMCDIGSNGANKAVVEHLDMKDEEDYAMMVRFLNFTKNDFYEDVKYISKESYDFFRKSQVFGGELIICKIGSAGQSYIMPNLNRPVSLGLNQILVRVRENILMDYLYQYLHSDYGERLVAGCVNGAVTKSITKTELKKMPVVLPPIELQRRFVDFVQQINKSKVVVQKALDEAQTLFDSLMQEYFG